MATKTFSQLVQSMVDNIRLTRPALDTKDGTVSRDLFIDLPADQLAKIYTQINNVSKAQSFLSATGRLLDQFGSNFGINRDTGKRAMGSAILTFTSIATNISIPTGSTLTAKNGVVFRITANLTLTVANKGSYSSLASKISPQLSLAGITDQYAVQVPVEALSVGKNGNVAVYSIIRHAIPGISNVTNIQPTTNGTDPQGDAEFKNSIISTLSGANVGTSRGYKNALLNVSGVSDVLVVEPGNPLLARDGTVSQRNSDGSLTVITPGLGGKVDLWVEGSDFINVSEAYVYHDLSGRNDPTSTANDHVLGQTIDTGELTIAERRNQALQTGEYPQQPVDSLITLTGSSSGSNFVLGVNYELVKDTSSETADTPFASDKLHFLSTFVSASGETIAKGSFNSVDKTSFKSVQEVSSVSQSITISNDLATLSSTDNTQVTIVHNPLVTALRVTNLTTGERYLITDQNNASGLNTTGAITVDGQILPTPLDKLQTDYIWSFNFDRNTDYFDPENSHFTQDAIDWGKSNYIEMGSALLANNGGRYQLAVTPSGSQTVNRVISAFFCQIQIAAVQLASAIVNGTQTALTQVQIPTTNNTALTLAMGTTDGIAQAISTNSFASVGTIKIDNELIDYTAITGTTFLNLTRGAHGTVPASHSIGATVEDVGTSTSLLNVVSVISNTTGLELYATDLGGSFNGRTITLATDVVQPQIGESVTIYYNSQEVYNITNNNGSISGTTITLSTNDVLILNNLYQPINDIFNNVIARTFLVNYVTNDASVAERTTIASMPFSAVSGTNQFVNNASSVISGRQPTDYVSGVVKRFGPSYLSFTVDSSFGTSGAFSVKGTGWFTVDTTFSVAQSQVSGVFDLSGVIASQLPNLSSLYYIARVSSVSVDGIKLGIRGYSLASNIYDQKIATVNSTLSNSQIDLSQILPQNGLTTIALGSTIEIQLYVIDSSTGETVTFTTGRGTLYTKYKYVTIDRITLLSGFVNPSTSLVSGNITVGHISQPSSGTSYTVTYNYTAPVENETLTIQYRYNNIIQDATAAAETVRPLTADVLTRLAVAVSVNVSLTIVIASSALDNTSSVLDNVTNSVNNLINSQAMGSTLDYSDIIRVSSSVVGVDGVYLTIFDYVGSEFDGTANRQYIIADPNEYFIPGAVVATPGTR